MTEPIKYTQTTLKNAIEKTFKSIRENPDIGFFKNNKEFDDSYKKFELLWSTDIKFTQDEINKYGKQYVEIRENFRNFRDKIKAQQSLSKKITKTEQKGYIGKMVDFALRSATTIGQPSTSGQPYTEEEYSQSDYAPTNISLPISEINRIIKKKLN